LKVGVEIYSQYC